MKLASVINFSSIQSACSQCNLHELCLSEGFSNHELKKLDKLVMLRRSVPRQQMLYRTRDSFEALYAVRSGFFKTTVLMEDGREQVTGFQMKGEILGMDGIGTSAHSCNSVALEDSEVCVIPFAELETLSRQLPSLQRNFHKLMSREIVRDQNLVRLLGSLNADERVAAFLVNLSKRFYVRHYSAFEFQLRMTREEMGSYLGLTLETVSRTLSKLQQEAMIRIKQRHIEILDMPKLKLKACVSDD